MVTTTPSRPVHSEVSAPLTPGLCSVALRHLDPAQVIDCAVAGGAKGIEWEARKHVPPGDLDSARRVGQLCRSAGLAIPSYGTYVTAGADEAREEFAACLASAEALGAPLLRIWTERTTGLEPGAARTALLSRVVSDLIDFCDLAAPRGLHLSLEFHPGTFTHTAAETLDLLQRVGRDNLLTHWQPDYGQPIAEATGALRSVLPLLSHLHVFCWTQDHVRTPLRDHRNYWKPLLDLAASAPDRALPRYAMIEFSPDNRLEAVLDDLQTLSDLL